MNDNVLIESSTESTDYEGDVLIALLALGPEAKAKLLRSHAEKGEQRLLDFDGRSNHVKDDRRKYSSESGR